MSVEKISDFAVGDIDLTAMMSTLNHAYKGQAQVTLSNYDNDSAPVVKVGSVFDNNGTQYAVTGSDETPTGYSGISNSTTFYLFFDESAEAFIYSSTVPTWSDDLQGWYNGNDRALFSMYKDSGGTLYAGKKILIQGNAIRKPIDLVYSKDDISSSVNLPDLELFQVGHASISFDTFSTSVVHLPNSGHAYNYSYTRIIRENGQDGTTYFVGAEENAPPGTSLGGANDATGVMNITYQRVL